MSIYEKLQVKEIINCSGKMTPYGSSILDENVAESMKQAAFSYVSMNELLDKTGKRIAEICGSESACICAGASAGVIISVAAIITQGDPYLVEKVPFVETRKKDILISCGHLIHFGAPIAQMIQLGGGNVKSVGTVCKTTDYHYENAIDENTAAILYVKSHHASQTGQLPLEKVIEIAHAHSLPLILDAAAEEDLRKYIAMECDLVAYSGAKAIGGPTSGIIVGKAELIKACRAQNSGVGRPMKVGKENIAGLLEAIESYDAMSEKHKLSEQKILNYMVEHLNGIEGVDVSIAKDGTREIYRVKLVIDPSTAAMSAKELDAELKNSTPIIYTRSHNASNGILLLDPRPMREGDEVLVCHRINEIMGKRNG